MLPFHYCDKIFNKVILKTDTFILADDFEISICGCLDLFGLKLYWGTMSLLSSAFLLLWLNTDCKQLGRGKGFFCLIGYHSPSREDKAEIEAETLGECYLLTCPLWFAHAFFFWSKFTCSEVALSILVWASHINQQSVKYPPSYWLIGQYDEGNLWTDFLFSQVTLQQVDKKSQPAQSWWRIHGEENCALHEVIKERESEKRGTWNNMHILRL